MESTKIQEVKQPLLKRTEAVYRIAFEGATPARTAIVQHLSSKEKGTVIVKSIKNHQGQQTLIATVSIYTDDKVAQSVERGNLIAKQQPKAAAETA